MALTTYELAFGAISAYLTYVAGLVIYRLCFHPLSRFPGPVSGAISRWPEFYYEVIKQGQFSKVIDQYHEKYGPIVRVVPNEIHIKDSQFYEEFYTKHGRADKMHEESARFGNEISTFATPDARLHAMRRGAVNQFFSRQRIVSLEPVIREKLNILINNIKKYEASGRPFDLKSAWNAFVGDVIMRYCFAFDYDHLNSQDFLTNWHEPFWAVTRTGPLAMQYPIIPKILNALPFALVERMDPLFAHLVRLRRDLIKKIKAVKVASAGKDETKTGKSVLADIEQNSSLPQAEKSIQRLMDEAQLLLAAGLLTTAWALSVGSFHIINDHSIFQTLRAELEAAVPDPNVPDAFKWTELEKLPYLTGCIKEAIRLSNPATHRSQRRYDEPLKYKDWVIPARTAIGMNQTDILNDERIFPEHTKFKPERWVNQDKTAYGPTIDKFNVLFGKGSRSCLGVNLAWCELYLAMAGTFRNFRFELFETDETDVQVRHDFWLPSPKLDSKGVRVKCLK